MSCIYKSYMNQSLHNAQSLHNSLIHTLNIHAPVLNKTTILRPNTSWYTIDLYRQKRLSTTSFKSLLKTYLFTIAFP